MVKVIKGCKLITVLFLSALLVLAAGCQALQACAEEYRYKGAIKPVFYFKDGEVYIISGNRAMELPDASVMEYKDRPYLDGMLSADKRYLYYLTNVNNWDYCGILYMVETQALSSPVEIARQVYQARLSADGGTLLYMTDVVNGMGKLYYRRVDGDSVLVAPSALYNQFGITRNGAYIYYITKENQSDKKMYTLYTQEIGKGALAIAEMGVKYPNDISANVMISEVGTVLYSLDTAGDNIPGEICIKRTGEDTEVVDKGRIEKTVNGVEEFFYTRDADRYYKAPGSEPVKIGGKFEDILIEPYFGLNPYHVVESRFLLASAGGDSRTLSEILPDGTRTVIAEGNFISYMINAHFTCVAYEQNGALYTVKKRNGQWGEPEKRGDLPKYYYFDHDGDVLYYILLAAPDEKSGFAYGLSLRSDEFVLQQPAYDLLLFEDVPHTLSDRFNVYRHEDGNVQLDAPEIGLCAWLYDTEGGYIVEIYHQYHGNAVYDLYFTEDGRSHELVLEDVGDSLTIWGISELF